MAFIENVIGGSVPCQVSSSVTAITLDSKGNYTSGGIQFGTAVKLDTTGKLGDVIIASTGNEPFGICITDPAAGPSASCRVQTLGVTKCRAGAAISLGDKVYVTDASGRVGTAPAAGVSQSFIVGTALEPAAQAEDLISVRLLIGAATQVNA